MKNTILFFLFSIFFWQCQPVNPPADMAENPAEESAEITYDSTLAAEVGADEYGMRRYVMAFLMRGPNQDQDSLTAANLQKAHLENIGRLSEEGKLCLAGPFFGDGELRGIYIFNVETIEEAEALTNTDPAIAAGRLEMELKPWYGSAALMKIPELHEKLEKKNVAE